MNKLNDPNPAKNDAQFPEQSNLFFRITDSDFSKFLQECLDLWDKCPEIGEKINRDQERKALDAKSQREAESIYWRNHNQQVLLNDESPAEQQRGCSEQLGVGRPRMAPLLVYIFIMLRGYLGSLWSQSSQDFIKESMSLRVFLDNIGTPNLPGMSTIAENINAVSESTLELIHRLQLSVIKQEGLDDFSGLHVDSTSVKANSEWPTDSKLILKLIERIWRTGRDLERFGMKGFRPSRIEKWLKELHRLDFEISRVKSTCGAKRKRKKLYGTYYITAFKAIAHLFEECSELLGHDYQVHLKGLSPLEHLRFGSIIEQITTDLLDALDTLKQSRMRIEEDITTKSQDKLLSLCDRSAAFIKKGDREAVIGYKPHIVRSSNGVITALGLEKANENDAQALLGCVKKSIQQTNTTPQWVGTDDGYSSKDGMDGLHKMDIKMVCFSGAKGRKIQGEDTWQEAWHQDLRRLRSGIESCIYTLKYNHRFGRMGRREIEAVRCEMLEKIIAFNLVRQIKLRQRLDRQMPMKVA